MNAVRLIFFSGLAFFVAAMWNHWRLQGGAAAASYVQRISIFGIAAGALWGMVTLPFWRGVFITLSALGFFSIMLPDEAGFLNRHPQMVFALPFVAGFTMAHLGRSVIGSIASMLVLVVLLVAFAKALASDPATSNLFDVSTPSPYVRQTIYPPPRACSYGTNWSGNRCW